MGVCDGLFGFVFSVDGNVLSGDLVAITTGLFLFSLFVVTVPVEEIILLLELVVGSGSRLGLAL